MTFSLEYLGRCILQVNVDFPEVLSASAQGRLVHATIPARPVTVLAFIRPEVNSYLATFQPMLTAYALSTQRI
jgi:hypothetical protein